MRHRDPERVIADVGRRIGEQRRERGWTQEVLAETLGVSLKYVQRIEAGRENLTIRSLVRFARLLATEIGALFDSPRERAPRRGRPRSDSVLPSAQTRPARRSR